MGCGAGDTALLLAELVGDDGLVIGVDRAPAAVAAAGDRLEVGKRNISFRLAGLDAIERTPSMRWSGAMFSCSIPIPPASSEPWESWRGQAESSLFMRRTLAGASCSRSDV